MYMCSCIKKFPYRVYLVFCIYYTVYSRSYTVYDIAAFPSTLWYGPHQHVCRTIITVYRQPLPMFYHFGLGLYVLSIFDLFSSQTF